MSDNKKRILDMLEAGKINAEEAMKLISAIEDTDRESVGSRSSLSKKFKYLRVIVDNPHAAGSDKPEKVKFCAEHNLTYIVLRRTPKEGLQVRSSTKLRGF